MSSRGGLIDPRGELVTALHFGGANDAGMVRLVETRLDCNWDAGMIVRSHTFVMQPCQHQFPMVYFGAS